MLNGNGREQFGHARGNRGDEIPLGETHWQSSTCTELTAWNWQEKVIRLQRIHAPSTVSGSTNVEKAMQ